MPFVLKLDIALLAVSMAVSSGLLLVALATGLQTRRQPLVRAVPGDGDGLDSEHAADARGALVRPRLAAAVGGAGGVQLRAHGPVPAALHRPFHRRRAALVGRPGHRRPRRRGRAGIAAVLAPALHGSRAPAQRHHRHAGQRGRRGGLRGAPRLHGPVARAVRGAAPRRARDPPFIRLVRASRRRPRGRRAAGAVPGAVVHHARGGDRLRRGRRAPPGSQPARRRHGRAAPARRATGADRARGTQRHGPPGPRRAARPGRADDPGRVRVLQRGRHARRGRRADAARDHDDVARAAARHPA